MIMRIAPYGLFVLGTLLTQVVHAASFVIDASQSYLELDLPTWRQGDPYELTNTETGETTLLGYQWIPDIRTERYALSGRFETLDGIRSDGLIPFGWTNVALFTDAPSMAQFSMPGPLAYDTLSGLVSHYTSTSCPYVEGLTSLCLFVTRPDISYSTVSGTRSGNSLTLDGVQKTGVSFVYAGFGLDRPLDPEVTNPTVRYHLVATAVPEPNIALTMLSGLALILATVRRSARCHGGEVIPHANV